MSYKMRKVFDVTEDMPEAVKMAIRETYEIQANGVYFEHMVLSKTYMDEQDDGTEVEVVCEEYSIIDEYFASCGCVAGEWVLILYWW